MPDGAYAALPVWSTRRQWFAAVEVARESPEGVELRRAWTKRWVADEPFWAIVHALASFADHRTGRGITAAHATIATRAGLLPRDVDTTTAAGQRIVRAAAKRVQQVTRILEAFGLYQLVRIGRPASRREIAALRAEGVAGAMTGNEAALTVPAYLAQAAATATPDERAIFHLPSARKETRSSSVSEIPSKPRARRTDAARPGRTGSSSLRRAPRTPVVPLSERAPAFRRLVASLDAAVVGPGGKVTGRFTQGRSVLGLVRILDDFGIDASWTADELLRRILRWEPHYRFRDGLAWFRHRLARAFRRPTRTTPVPPTPPEFRGHSDLERLWVTDETFRGGWYRLQALHATQDGHDVASAASTGTNTAATRERAADGRTAPQTTPRPLSEWRRELDAAQARVDAEDDAAWAAGVAAARAAGGSTTATRSRVPYLPGR